MLLEHMFDCRLILLVSRKELINFLFMVLELDPVLVDLNLQIGLGVEQGNCFVVLGSQLVSGPFQFILVLFDFCLRCQFSELQLIVGNRELIKEVEFLLLQLCRIVAHIL